VTKVAASVLNQTIAESAETSLAGFASTSPMNRRTVVAHQVSRAACIISRKESSRSSFRLIRISE
jgi:hypothetical protein